MGWSVHGVRNAKVLVSVLFVATGLAAAADREVQFNRDVRPILSDRCYGCHGPDAKAKGAPMRLDIEASAKGDLGGRRAIVEGDPGASRLVARITSTDPAQRMPPEWSGLKLSEREIETLRDWIAQGAKWERHWSFTPPKRPEPPSVKQAAWPRNDIDRFVLARLEREGLRPSPEASRETLLRRVTLDLTGLPPAPAEIDAFLADRTPGAYERAVDRLLGSPRYGERMAARWLDAARYADSNGYQYDGERSMWRWRDWVIDAFNRNQPFDRFALEQLAGDMLPGAARETRIATGFNRNHRGNSEDGIVAEEYAVEYVVDRVETTSATFLGLTLGCARCHNHKYDPFSQREFYQLFAYFNNVPERGRAMKYGNSPPVVAAPTREQQDKLARIESGIAALRRKLDDRSGEIEAARDAWKRALPGAERLYWVPSRGLAACFPLDGASGLKEAGGKVGFRPGRIGQAASLDGAACLDAGDVAAFDIEDPFTLAAWVYADSAPHGSIVTRMVDGPKGKGFGLELDQGKVYAHVTSEWKTDALRLVSEETLAPKRWYHLAMTYNGSSLAEGVTVYLDGKPVRCRIELDTLYRPFRNAGRPFKEPLRIGGGAGPERRFRGMIDDVRVYGRVLGADELGALALGEPLGDIAARPAAERSASEKLALERYFLEQVAPADVREAWRKLEALEEEKRLLERSFPTVMAMAENPTPRETHLLVRGAYDKPGEKVRR